MARSVRTTPPQYGSYSKQSECQNQACFLGYLIKLIIALQNNTLLLFKSLNNK
ncbi:hypothetical protein [Piscirickettsia salmonis]|uniref:hypothetical protein n=1 Tax=Piscirickettsia salmonis TaxID=1238 RepID=UPI000B239533|nr:hypothetical protein [Piscirickettsia salmonis]QIX55736.1 hypothetical protein GW536_10095 [Piscirickettsia salmonis]